MTCHDVDRQALRAAIRANFPLPQWLSEETAASLISSYMEYLDDAEARVIFAERMGINGQQRKLFNLLLKRAGRVVYYQHISEALWPRDADLPENYVSSVAQAVFWLRRRLKNTPYTIETASGDGYVLRIKKETPQ